MKISIVIPTKNAENYIKNLIESLNNQTIKPYEIIVMDSNSIDNTKSICMQFKNTKVFQVIDFNHGKTRNDGVKIAVGDIIIFMTQDAIPKDNYLIENLVKPLNNDIVGSYARQVANKNSDSIEKFSRQFNYPDFDIIKNNNRISELGIKSYFFSNVCSAFIRKEFFRLGGFPEDVIMNEDMVMASKILNSNKSTYYASDAIVIHSHKYSYKEQFKRNFDVGVALVDNKDYFGNTKSESEGIKFVKEAIKFLIKNNRFYLIPHLVIQSCFKYLGFKFGSNYKKLPLNIVKKMSMHSFYFDRKEKLL